MNSFALVPNPGSSKTPPKKGRAKRTKNSSLNPYRRSNASVETSPRLPIPPSARSARAERRNLSPKPSTSPRNAPSKAAGRRRGFSKVRGWPHPTNIAPARNRPPPKAARSRCRRAAGYESRSTWNPRSSTNPSGVRSETTRPPGRPAASSKRKGRPASANTLAQVRPANPAPTTMVILLSILPRHALNKFFWHH